MSYSPARVLLVALLASLPTACATNVYGRVISDVRIANGWISVDRCELQQGYAHGVHVANCHTENYYLGAAAIPQRSTR